MSQHLFTNVNVLDCTGKEPFAGEVRVKDNEIIAIARDGEALDRDGSEVHDGEGRMTLMPGLVESHAHLSIDNTDDLAALHAKVKHRGESAGQGWEKEGLDTVLQAGVSLGIGARLAFEDDGAAIRKNKTVPDQQHTPLSEADIVGVFADNARSLGDEQDLAGRAIIDVLRDLGRYQTGQVRSNAGDERGRDHGPGLKDIGRCRRRNAIRGDGLPVYRPVEKRRVAILCRGLLAKAETGKAGHGRSGLRSRAQAGLEKHIAQACGFFLGAAAFFLGIDRGRCDRRRCDRLAPPLGVEDRTAKVAGQRGAEDRAGVVGGQARESVRRGPVFCRIEFFAARSGSSMCTAQSATRRAT